MTIEQILERVGPHAAEGFGWAAVCPVCSGQGALRISQRSDGSVALECLEGCGFGKILKGLSLASADLAGDGAAAAGKKRKAPRKPLNFVRRYEYQLPDGSPIYRVSVTTEGETRLQSYFADRKEKWVFGRSSHGVPAVPYRLPQVIAAVREGRTVWIVPTERDVEAMEELGLVATCCLGDHDKKDGAGEWQPEFCRWFADSKKTTVIIAKKDPAPKPNDVAAALKAYLGQRRATRIQGLMASAGVRRTHVLVLPDRGDVRIESPEDWVNAGGTKDELFVAVKASPPWECPDALGQLGESQLKQAAGAATAALEKAAASSSPSSESGLEIPAGAPSFSTPTGQGENVGGIGDSDPRSVAELRGTFIKILSDKQLDVRQKREYMELAVIQWLLGRGKLFFHSELKTCSTSMYFDAVDKRLSYISRDYFRSWLSLAMRTNTESGDFRFIVARVAAEALAGGDKTSGIVPERFWARRGNRIYLSCGHGRMVRCSPGGAEVVDVGTDKVLFEEGNECQPWALLDGEGEDPFETCEVFRTMNAIYPRGKMLLKLWTMSIPGHGERTRPILLLTGKGRSGKTVLALMIMELFGIPAKATMVSKDYKTTDFWTLADAGGVMCLDNADSFTEWLPNCLCTVATCGSFSKKMNYKDNELITQRANCWCCVTGTTPYFASEHTVADRLLTVELFSRGIGDTKGDSLKYDIRSRRDAALTWICKAWCRALSDQSCPPSSVNARHPDWGETAYRLARAVGMEDEAVAAMTESEASKAVFALRNDALGTFLIEAFGESGFSGTSGEMAEALKQHCDGFDGDKTWTLPKIGKALKRLEDHLVSAFQMKKADHSGRHCYTLSALSDSSKPPSKWGVDALPALSAHTGDRAGVTVPSPPTPPTFNNLLGEDGVEREWDL